MFCPVTRVTTPETRQDNLTDEDYREIYQEVRTGKSLRQFLLLTRSSVSPSFWSQYEQGTKSLTTERKNELRRAVNLPELAPDPAQALSEVTEDVQIWRIGQGAANRILMITPETTEPFTVSINGAISINSGESAQNSPEPNVTPVTRQSRTCVGIGGLRPETRSQLDAARRAQSLTWDAFLLSLIAQTLVTQ